MQEELPGITPALFYEDPQAALAFLEKAFGFELEFSVTDNSGQVVHAEMAFGTAKIRVGGTGWAPYPCSPTQIQGKTTVGLHLVVPNVDAHCQRARQAGAEIVAEPEDQFYGDRTYRALDGEGHFWTFSHHVREVSFEEMAQATGLQFEQRGGN